MKGEGKMKVYTRIFFILLVFNLSLFAQKDFSEYFNQHPEIYFTFNISSKAEADILTAIISIDNIIGNTVFAYANEEEFSEFLKLGYKYAALTRPSLIEPPVMSSGIEDFMLSWDSYPTYEIYVSMMAQYAANYPDICQLIDAGNTVQGRKILFVKISDNVNIREPEPQFMFSSTMHGDETTGYILMLRLIDSLLASYGTDTRITNLINNIEIWINPNANPDGTYRTGNHTVSGATRSNANNVDLNRNFPDPVAGPHPDGKAWQPETIAMMNLAQTNTFIHSANFHGGAEVVNYPWDTWAQLHADNNWFIYISRRYADTVHANSSPPYMRGFNNGITNGYAWYRITGGRQDYYTYFARGRETTIEISNTKLLPASQLPAHWNYNKKSFLDYIENTLYGIRGIVTDTSGNPLKALISISGHDFNQSEIYSDSLTGFYNRMIMAGTYTLIFSAPDHFPQTVQNVTVANLSSTELNVQLIPDPIPVELISFTAVDAGGKVKLNWQTAAELNNYGFEIEKEVSHAVKDWERIGFVEGKGTSTEISGYTFIDEYVNAGKNYYRLKQIDFDGSFKIYGSIEVEVSPQSFSLEQNYPNPFNPATTITFYLPYETEVNLTVYDVLGNEISQLLGEVINAGKHNIHFSSEGLPSGIYFYRLIAEGNNFVRKMLVVK